MKKITSVELWPKFYILPISSGTSSGGRLVFRRSEDGTVVAQDSKSKITECDSWEELDDSTLIEISRETAKRILKHGK